MSSQTPHMFPTVLLRHDLPDGSHHFDWMISTDTAGEQPLTTFRLQRRLDQALMGEQIDAEHIGDHRSAYLTYEGPLSGNRGSVKRAAKGRIESNIQEIRPDRTYVVKWERDNRHVIVQRISLRKRNERQWVINVKSDQTIND